VHWENNIVKRGFCSWTLSILLGINRYMHLQLIELKLTEGINKYDLQN